MAAKRTWFDHFRYAMDSVGCAVPTSLFQTQEKAVSTINGLVGVVKTFGTRVTILELVKAGTLSEVWMVVGACSAAFYVGACIGAAAYATGEWTAENLWAVAPASGSLDKIIVDAARIGIGVPKAVAIHTQRSAGSLAASLA